jgi:phage terminase large subunit
MAFPPIGALPKRIINVSGPEADVTDRIFGYLWKWIVEDRCLGYAPVHKSKRLRYIEMPWGARVEGKTTDNPDSLLGDGVAIQAGDEHALNADDILSKYMMPTMFDTGGIILLTTTPEGKLNHCYETWQEWGKLAKTDPRYFISHSTSYDNPHLDKALLDEYCEKETKKGNGDLVRQQIFAEFTAMQGAVYPGFSPTLGNRHWHVDPNLRIIDDLGFTNGYDWGFQNPFVCLFAQVTPDDRILVHDMIYKAGMTDDECAQEVLKKEQELGIKIKGGYADPSAPEAIKTFRQYGIPINTPSKAKDVARINSVTEGIRDVRAQIYREDRPGLEIHPRCATLIAEIDAYTFKKKTLKEEPEKLNDHSPDALRYLTRGAIGMRKTKPFLYIPG